jgi:hypothetical protein
MLARVVRGTRETRRRSVVVAAAFVLSVALSAIALTAQPGVAPPSQQQAGNQSVAVRSLPAIDIERNWIDYAPIALGVLTVLIAIVGSVVSYQAFKDQRDTVRLTQRADVLIDSINTSNSGGLTPDTVVTVVFKNFGPTRANEILLDAWLGVEGSEIGEPEPLPMTALATGDTLPYAFHPLHERMTADAFKRLQTGELTLRITGTLKYRDVFKRPHAVDFVARWRPEGNFFSTDKNDAD